MAENHVLLETIQLTQPATSITFDNLPSSGYTELKIIVSARCTDTTVNKWVAGYLNFNGVTTNLSSITNAGRWTAVDSFTDGSTAYCFWASGSDTTANCFGVTEISIPDYLSTTQNKLYSSDWAEANNDSFYQILGHSGGRWNSNSAITSITLTPQVGSHAAGSTFSLYGISTVNITPTVSPKATGGNLVATDGTFWYHAFTSSGYFIPQTSLNAKVMVIGGGAGGGAHISGGGGAGAINDFTNTYALTSGTAYTCAIGAGGGGNTGTAKGSPGIDSVFTGTGLTTITAKGGGYGGGNDLFPGGPGGSGGGAAASGGGAAGGTASGPNTFAGGSGWYGPYPIYSAGGGGGATAAGGNGSTSASVGGNGGQGMLLSSIDSNLTTVLTGALSGMTRVSSGGGGCGQNPAGGAQTGGTGGTGGGNGGFGSTNATNATSYGSGGGGGNWSDAGGGATGDGGNGYQGIVIIRYPVAS